MRPRRGSHEPTLHRALPDPDETWQAWLNRQNNPPKTVTTTKRHRLTAVEAAMATAIVTRKAADTAMSTARSPIRGTNHD